MAVLPFEDLNPGDQAGYFVRGMHEAVLTSLASLEDLVVTSPGSVLPAEATRRAPGAIARELGVSYLLLGSVQRAGDRIRVTARLLDAETGRQLWAERLERRFTADEVFDIQSRVARATASALDVSLSPEERGRLARRPTGQIEAYDYYLRGQERLGFVAGEPVVDREAVEQAMALFDQALRLDPDFALAHVGLARSYMGLAEMEGGPWDDSVRVAAARALELDPRLPGAHLAMAWFHRSRKGTEGRAAHLEEIRHVLELRPNDSRAALEVAWRWSIKRGMGRLDQIACWSKRAAQLEPTNPELLRVMALFFWTLGDHEAAQRRAERALKLEPDAIRIYELLVRIALSRGDRAGALAHYEMARSVASSSAPDLTGLGMMETYLGMLDSARVHLDAVSGRLERFPEKVIHFAYALWETGYRERAGEILAWREARERRVLEREILGFWPAFNLARVLAVRGEIEGAVDAMEVTVERGGWLYAQAAPEIDGPLRKLWGNERFDSLMAEARSEAERMRGRIEREGCDAIRELPEPEGLSVR